MERLQEKALYGAKELKKAIGGNTIKAFIASGSLLSLLFSLFLIFKPVTDIIETLPGIPNGPVIEIDPPVITKTNEKSGIKASAPEKTTVNEPNVPENITKNLKTLDNLFAVDETNAIQDSLLASLETFDKVGNSNNDIYKDPGFGNGNGQGNGNGNNKNGTGTEELPDKDEFIAVEEYPKFDMEKLASFIEYPLLAKQAGIEGRVIVSVLVHKSGEILKADIAYTKNTLLNKAALDAINKYGMAKPAIQNGEKITTWINIPLNFRLRR